MASEAATAIERPTLLGWMQRMREEERERTRMNPFVLRALEEEKREGQRIATSARMVALVVIALFLPFLNPTIEVLYYEAFIVVLMVIGWAQQRVATVGRSRAELALIFLELALLTFIAVVPSPIDQEGIPTAFNYRFETFIYFFVILAAATLAYSWRTLWAIGTWVALLWVAGLCGVLFLGQENVALGEAAQSAFAGYPDLVRVLDPNTAQIPLRIQEIIVFVIVTAMLGLRGWRSNQLLLKQAEIAAERANLSRYFSPNMVDLLASDEHDPGAVRSQDIAVLFVDIVGFTEIAERGTPAEVMELLRRYHALIEEAIFENGGTLDKYLGDGVMATFGTPQPGPDDAANALAAAGRIIAGMEQFNRESAARGAPSLKVSAGLHFGPAIIGNIGPSRRLEFAVVGDTVNVASRLEAASRELGCSIIVSDALMEQARSRVEPASGALPSFQRRDGVALRGRSGRMDVWTC
jgi:adenylate cyclase